ncbi:MAG: rhomboid family intramembrane serine protease [Planctomycetota bacterium]|jgi:membrane associated rhomboid family serine protease
MFIPIRTDYRMSRTPWVNYALVAANVIIYFLGFHAANQAGFRRIYDHMLHPDSPALAQFFTSMFLHGSFWHLAGNMLFLWVFGNAVNDRFGHAGYLAFYLAGGILAGVGYLLLRGTAPVLGASGAIAAVTGAYLVLLPRSRVTVLLLLFYVLIPRDIPSLYFLMFQFIWNLMQTLSNVAGKYAGGGGVAYAAHSSGYIFGIAISAALLALRLLPRDAFDLLNLISTKRRRTRYQRMVQRGYDPFSGVSPDIRKPAGQWVETRTVEQTTPETPAARELALRRDISEAMSRYDLPGAAKKYLQLVQVADDPVLSQQQQLDIANHLMASEQHAPAADAYERIVRHYGDYEYIADIYLMLGVLYGRYLHQYDRAEQSLQRAIDLLDDPQKLEMARNDLNTVRQRRSR